MSHWLEWAREIQAVAQTGSHYAVNEFDRGRYRRLSEIAAEIINEHSTLDYIPVLQIFSRQTGYATPRVDVRAAVFNQDKLLMVRERLDGGWTMPGGWADVGDIPSLAVEREVREEAGYEVKACRLIGIYDANRIHPLELFHAFKLIFLCDLMGGEPRPSDETSQVAFFGRDEIPAVLSGERTTPRHIADVFAAHADPHLPSKFD
jgi:ADP-ribose pyrophosphatase YjhB (NUDIX family)